MKVSGYKISGGSYVGRPTLATIGNMLFWYDYRYSYEVENQGGNDMLVSWGDLSPSGIHLIKAQTSTRLQRHSDGVGQVAGVSASRNIGTSDIGSKVNVMHNGGAYMAFAVMRYNNPSNVIQNTGFVSSYRPGTTPGISFFLRTSDHAIVHEFRGAAGASLGAQVSGAGTVPQDSTYRLVTYTYYGLGGSNNSIIRIADSTTHTATRNPGLQTSDAGGIFVSTSNGAADLVRIKCVGAYNLSGKTTTQINDFLALFYSMLKSDPEYATLITP
jgi:hypothetical protein